MLERGEIDVALTDLSLTFTRNQASFHLISFWISSMYWVFQEFFNILQPLPRQNLAAIGCS